MAGVKRNPNRTGWYSISVDSLRTLLTFLVLVVLGVVGYFAFRAWKRDFVQREAERLILEGEAQVEELTGRQGTTPFANELEKARRELHDARREFEAVNHQQALDDAQSATSLLAWITEALAKGDEVGEAQFLSAAGEVSFRRGETGEWQPARSRLVLAVGDYVRTGERGSAEIMFANGTLYTIRANTLFRLSQTKSSSGKQEQAIRMDYGWVNLNTSRQESGVSTPDAEAVVDRDSFASVSYDRDSKEARFVSFEGKVSVAASDGTQRQLGQREQVVQAQKGLSQAQEVPPAPVPSQPPENLQLNLANTDRLAFAWEPVAGATRYALQVARDHLFVDTIIDRSDRTRPGATLGLRGEGTFFWRVAAVNRAGVAGAWSEPRRFRVASFGVGDAGDKEPPHLALQNPESYGTIFILGGATEPGAQVEVNGEPVAVASDGAFRKTIQLTQEGWNVVSIRARDASGNETERRQRVFVELY